MVPVSAHFFYKRFGHHQDLHSFPTRRSSDLLSVNDRADIAVAVGADVLHLGQDDLPVRQARQVVGEDRSEGTRLNSSHSQISYAVFCLKKKSLHLNTSVNQIEHALHELLRTL